MKATAVYGFFREAENDLPSADQVEKGLRKRAVEDFQIGKDGLKNEDGKEVGKYFDQDYRFRPF